MSARRLCFVFALVAPALLSGCGGPKMRRVKGCVTCNGKPVPQAAVTFSPLAESEKDREPGKPATGFTDDEGNYDLSTFRAYDGALRGKHRVTVVLDDPQPGPLSAHDRAGPRGRSGREQARHQPEQIRAQHVGRIFGVVQ